MVVWRLIGNEIGPDGNGAYYFATKAEALKEQRNCLGDPQPDGPDKIVVRNREELVAALHDAMGYGAS